MVLEAEKCCLQISVWWWLPAGSWHGRAYDVERQSWRPSSAHHLMKPLWHRGIPDCRVSANPTSRLKAQFPNTISTWFCRWHFQPTDCLSRGPFKEKNNWWEGRQSSVVWGTSARSLLSKTHLPDILGSMHCSRRPSVWLTVDVLQQHCRDSETQGWQGPRIYVQAPTYTQGQCWPVPRFPCRHSVWLWVEVAYLSTGF